MHDVMKPDEQEQKDDTELNAMDYCRGVMYESTEALRARTEEIDFAKAKANAIGKIMKSFSVEIEYMKLAGIKPAGNIKALMPLKPPPKKPAAITDE